MSILGEREPGAASRGSRIAARNLALLVLLLVTGLAGGAARWIRPDRESIFPLEGSAVAVVSSEDDVGIGSLRQAIFDANLAQGRARIQFTAHHVRVRSPLPPLVNPVGMVIEGGGTTTIEADLPKDAPLFEASSPRVGFWGLKLRAVGGTAIQVNGGAVAVTGVDISDSHIGILVGGSVKELRVEKSTFDSNDTGVLILSDAQVAVLGSHFRRHLSAGIWAALSPPSASGPSRRVIRGNTFQEDRIGLSLIHADSRVEENEFRNCREAGLFLSGRAGEIKRNRVHSGAIGIQAEETQGLLIEGNEIDHNSAMGLLLRSSSRGLVRANRLHGNGYGIALILGSQESPVLVEGNVLLGQKVDGLFVLGGSPGLRDNHVMGSGGAALRILDYVPSHGGTIFAHPRLEANSLTGNLFDEPVRGRYLVPPVKGPSS
ncbi:MAG TPA: right-handed parallel beta-helix repeat-containing protein [Candidatus Polarisedimenticolia bacterium]|nr:right-handed parallel beta-helix repeat-containing protein [Candidatus Polarisedimenticolia bacterium]